MRLCKAILITFGIADCIHSVKIASSSEWFGLSSESSFECLNDTLFSDLAIIGFLFAWLVSTGEDDGVPYMLNLCDSGSDFFMNGMLFVGGGVVCLGYE